MGGVLTLACFMAASVAYADAATVPGRTLSPSSVPASTIAAAPTCVTAVMHPGDGRIASYRHCADTPELINLRGGPFRMGDAIGSGQPYERPVHEVSIKPFAIGRFEVTRAEWAACRAAGACEDPHEAHAAGDGRLPIAGVSWLMVQGYLKWLVARTGKPYRLPSEAEWEYAARAGAEGTYNWGAFSESICRHANALDLAGSAQKPELTWFSDCNDGFAEAAPVGSFPSNAWGIHDMLGNVWEWVADCWHPDYSDAPVDGSAWTRGGNCRKRVNRGGGWGNGAFTLRLSNRDADPADATSDALGFRVALGIVLPPPAATPARTGAPSGPP